MRRDSITFLFILLAQLLGSDAKDCTPRVAAMAHASLNCCKLTEIGDDDDYKNCVKEVHESASLDRAPTIKESIDMAVCLQECFFTGNGYVDVDPPYNLDYENIHDHLIKIMPEPKQEAMGFMMLAYSKCENFRKNFPKKLDISYPQSDLFDHYCSPYSQQIASCTRIFAIQECPETFFQQNEQCAKVRKYFKECVANINKL